MTDNQVKEEVEENTSPAEDLSLVSNEAIMISNLPLLFADGYPTCLEKFTLVSRSENLLYMFNWQSCYFLK